MPSSAVDDRGSTNRSSKKKRYIELFYLPTLIHVCREHIADVDVTIYIFIILRGYIYIRLT